MITRLISWRLRTNKLIGLGVGSSTITRRSLLACGAAASVLLAETMPTRAQEKPQGVISGAVVYRERMALPPGAMVEVQLLDVSRVGAPARSIAKQSLPATGGRTVFELRFDPARIDTRFSYTIRAAILLDGKLLFTSDAHQPAFSRETGVREILVRRVSDTVPPLTEGPEGRWLAEDIGGAGVLDRVQTVLDIGLDSAVSGSGGCNRIRGQASIDGTAVRFADLASTNMACPEAVLRQEQRFFQALAAARAYQLHPVMRKLVLLDASGAPVAQFSAMAR